jgi:hypothetical protein
MKKSLFFLLGMSVLLFSCKKSASSGNGGGTISASINGVNETFNTDASALQVNAAGTYNIEVAGYHGAAGASDQLAFSIGGTQAIKSGTYQYSYANPNSDAVDLIFVQYSSGGNNQFVSDPSNTTNPVTVNITSISSTNIQGTFNGVLPSFSGGSGTETVTNGKFNVSIKQ